MFHVLECFREPLSRILNMEQSVHMHFMREKMPPFESVAPEDEIYFRTRDGFAVARAKVDKVEDIEDLNPDTAKQIIEEHKQEFVPTKMVLEREIFMKNLTMIWLKDVEEIEPIDLSDKYLRNRWFCFGDENMLWKRR